LVNLNRSSFIEQSLELVKMCTRPSQTTRMTANLPFGVISVLNPENKVRNKKTFKKRIWKAKCSVILFSSINYVTVLDERGCQGICVDSTEDLVLRSVMMGGVSKITESCLTSIMDNPLWLMDFTVSEISAHLKRKNFK